MSRSVLVLLSFKLLVLLGKVSQLEFEALKDFYDSTNGDYWFNNTNWQFELLNITR